MLKITALPKATKFLVNRIYQEEKHGDVGRSVEDDMDFQGYPINKKNGPDIEQIETEIKTRTSESKSGLTIGKMKIEDIAALTWEESPLYKKSKFIYKVTHSKIISQTDNEDVVDFSPDVLKKKFKEERKVDNAEIFDFSKEHIQSILRSAYEEARTIINKIGVENFHKRYIRSEGSWAYFENTLPKRPKWYDFRIPHHRIKDLELASTSTYTNLFSS